MKILTEKYENVFLMRIMLDYHFASCEANNFPSSAFLYDKIRVKTLTTVYKVSQG